MPSFDIVSEVNLHELTNAVDQASREVSQRFDFKGTNAKFELKEAVVTGSSIFRHATSIARLESLRRRMSSICFS
jgi:hypothetical protein